MPELKTMLALVKNEEDHHFALLLKDVDSKMQLEVRGEWHAQFQNAMDSVMKIGQKMTHLFPR
jgi:hypothetical protein